MRRPGPSAESRTGPVPSRPAARPRRESRRPRDRAPPDAGRSVRRHAPTRVGGPDVRVAAGERQVPAVRRRPRKRDDERSAADAEQQPMPGDRLPHTAEATQRGSGRTRPTSRMAVSAAGTSTTSWRRAAVASPIAARRSASFARLGRRTARSIVQKASEAEGVGEALAHLEAAVEHQRREQRQPCDGERAAARENGTGDCVDREDGERDQHRVLELGPLVGGCIDDVSA